MLSMLRGLTRKLDAQADVTPGRAVGQQVGELKQVFLQPVDRGQQHQMGKTLAVAQMQQVGRR
jgi:hypothetical protein